MDEQREKEALINIGVMTGKITPATRRWWENLTVEEIKIHLPQAPVLIYPKGDSK